MSEAYDRFVRCIRPFCSEKNLTDILFDIDTEERQNAISDMVESGKIKTENDLIQVIVEKQFFFRESK